MKTADLAIDDVVAYKKNSNGANPALVLDTTTWTVEDKFACWDGPNTTATRARCVRRTGFSPRAFRGWGNYSVTGLPVIVLDIREIAFMAQTNPQYRYVKSAAELLREADEKMNVRQIVAEDHDGRYTTAMHRRVDFPAETCDGSTREIGAFLEFVRPQTLLSDWTSYLQQAVREEEDREAHVRVLAERKAVAADQFQTFTSRLNILLGQEDIERNDFRQQLSDLGTGTPYQVSAEIIEQLLTLAEKGKRA